MSADFVCPPWCAQDHTVVHRDDAPAPPPAAAEGPVGVVVADQGANTNANNTPTAVSREGMTIITDPADHHRTMVHGGLAPAGGDRVRAVHAEGGVSR